MNQKCPSDLCALHRRNVGHDDDELSSCWCRTNDTNPGNSANTNSIPKAKEQSYPWTNKHDFPSKIFFLHFDASRCHSFPNFLLLVDGSIALHWRNVDHDDDELSSCWCRANDTARRKRNKPPSRFQAYSANWRLLTLTRIVYYNYVKAYWLKCNCLFVLRIGPNPITMNCPVADVALMILPGGRETSHHQDS